MTYHSMGNCASMHLIEFTGTRYFEKDIILPYCHQRNQDLPQHCHKSNQLVGVNNDLLFNGKSASMHLMEITRAKYFEKDIIVPYCP